LKMPLILLGGITNRETMDLAMAEGFDFVAMGRALLAEPDLINRIRPTGRRTRFSRRALTATSAWPPSTATRTVW
jgi:2,4-dienoyl-CoA reductase-like NADH-dependent reductase (Old Yellow Enzyme family)